MVEVINQHNQANIKEALVLILIIKITIILIIIIRSILQRRTRMLKKFSLEIHSELWILEKVWKFKAKWKIEIIYKIKENLLIQSNQKMKIYLTFFNLNDKLYILFKLK